MHVLHVYSIMHSSVMNVYNENILSNIKCVYVLVHYLMSAVILNGGDVPFSRKERSIYRVRI